MHAVRSSPLDLSYQVFIPSDSDRFSDFAGMHPTAAASRTSFQVTSWLMAVRAYEMPVFLRIYPS